MIHVQSIEHLRMLGHVDELRGRVRSGMCKFGTMPRQPWIGWVSATRTYALHVWWIRFSACNRASTFAAGFRQSQLRHVRVYRWSSTLA